MAWETLTMIEFSCFHTMTLVVIKGKSFTSGENLQKLCHAFFNGSCI